MTWTEFVVTVPRADADTAAAVATALCDGGIYIEDYADLEQQVREIAHVDLIDASLLAKPKDTVAIHLYQSEAQNVAAFAQALHGRLQAAGVTYALQRQNLRQEDWENSWKQYYHTTEFGARLAVVPSWEAYAGGRVALRLDPGMAFGTGTHETTALCLEELDARVEGGESVLDVGSGSGILAVAALLLGAKSALCIDIDPTAVRVAAENAARNGVAGRLSATAGDLAGKAHGRYHIITANIVADAVMRLAPDIPRRLAPGGVFIASGIIDEREAEVAQALQAAGLALVGTRRAAGWVMMTATGG